MKAIPIFYSTRLLADSESFSPSASKPKLVLASWQQLGIPLDIRPPTPLTREQFCLAHSENFVNKVLDLRGDNGFDNRSAEVAISLPYTNGSIVDAAREAILNGEVAVAPVAGFHHAHHDYVQSFCTFNGLVIAAQIVKQEGLANKVGILDLDNHFGNGTIDIIRYRKLGDWLSQYSSGAEYFRRDQAAGFLARIPSLVDRFADCDVLLYQAGGDPHIDDPLGGWLDTEQLKERDRLVFQRAKEIGLPVAWDLAGGYQTNFRKVLDIHDNTLSVCWDVYGEATTI
jgi:acetoin utilization deacetylase AcuC-like enzyme